MVCAQQRCAGCMFSPPHILRPRRRPRPCSESQPGTPSQRKITEYPVTFKFLVPSNLVGPLLGHKGENLCAIRERTNAHIVLGRYGSATLSDKDRILVLGGPDVECCKDAVREMLATIQREGATDRLRKPRHPSKIYFKQIIPAASAGKVLGPSGETINALSTRTYCSVVVEAKTPNSAFVPFRFVNYMAASTDRIAVAVAEVMDLITKDERYQAQIRDINSVAFKVMQVPERRVGSILGPGGAHVQALQELLRVKIGLTEDVTKNGCRHVSVYGPPANVRVALDVIAVCTGGSPQGKDAAKETDDVLMWAPHELEQEPARNEDGDRRQQQQQQQEEEDSIARGFSQVTSGRTMAGLALSPVDHDDLRASDGPSVPFA